MDMSGMGDGMGMGMGMGTGARLPSSRYLQQMYWAAVGAVIALATAVHLGNVVLAYGRLHAARRKQPTPAQPKTGLLRAYATVTAIAREVGYATPPALGRGRYRLGGGNLSMGQVLVVLGNALVVLVLCFYRFNLTDPWQWELVGYRTGDMALAQLPLIFLLAGKRNVIGLVTGSSHERLNYLHRWTGRVLFLTASIHMGYWFADWNRFDYIKVKVQTDPITQKGLGAWVVLAWMTLSSLLPLRRWCYEFFVVQHLVSMAAFVAMVYVHTPQDLHRWIWIPVGFFALDRLARAVNVLYQNASVFHPGRRRRLRRRQAQDRQASGGSSWLTSHAELTPLDGDLVRLTIHQPAMRWTAGQHVFLACHSLLPLQSHPFTIASLPSDDKLEIVIRARTGGTRHYLRRAERDYRLPGAGPDPASDRVLVPVLLEGPYGYIRPLRQFDHVVLFAGGVGATFVVPLMRDLVRRCAASEAVTRRVRLVWVVRSTTALLGWKAALEQAVRDVVTARAQGVDLRLEISLYTTCDTRLTQLDRDSPPPGSCPPAPSASPPCLEADAIQEKDEKDERDEKDPPDHTTSEPSSIVLPSRPPGCCCCQQTISDEAGTIAHVGGGGGSGCACNNDNNNNHDQTSTPPRPPSPRPGSSTTSSASTTAPLDISNIRRSRADDDDDDKDDKDDHDHDHRRPAPPLRYLAGRPHVRALIRTALERARGETAVVVCGPPGLAADVRASVVALSDERAVHKGTGAQAVWLHVEGFGS
ncbi:MAG: hypothetical protein M1826_003421 [Phylliscum demangeonii]|nr:MAG: hypothetical protein M1826_003421 [Phylliscum demangeonii]